MKDNNSLVEQKSLLAKLMAAENITVQHKKIPTAAFDVKNRVLYLPILKWKPGSAVYDLFCAHEVGHALWTPEEGWHSSVSKKGKGFKSFLNVVEDARIEKKIKRKFAGARKSMIDGYGALMDNDFFGLRKMGVNANDLGLIDRINLYTKAGTDYGIEFSDEEREWVEKIMRTETFEDVLELTEALYEYCKENESETDNSYGDFSDEYEWSDEDEDEESEGSEDSDGSEEMEDFDIDMAGDESAESDSEEDGVSGSGSNGEKSEDSDDSDSGLNSFEKEVQEAMDKMREERESKSGDSSNDSSENSNNDPEDSDPSSGMEGGKGNAFDRKDMSSGPVSLTDENFRENEEEMADLSESVSVPIYLTFPKINTDSIIIDFKKIQKELSEYYESQENAVEYGNVLLKKFKNANDKMVNYMAKEFEMKKAADIHRRAYSSKKGTLDMNKIHAYKYSENLFQQITNLPEGKNHGMVMFIDWSGSMSAFMKDTIEQLVNLTMFCSKVQIPFEVYAFSDSRYTYYYNSGYSYFGMPPNFSLGGTPLDDTIIASKSIIDEFKMRTKAQIVNAVFLTDGASSTSCSYLNEEGRSGDYDYRSMHIDDKKNKVRVFPEEAISRYSGGRYTSMYLTGLKKTSGINLLGFFLTSGSGRRAAGNISAATGRYPKDSELSEFRKNKFLIEKGTAYDELYVINVKGLEIDEVDHIGQVAAGSSKAEIRKALKKNTKGKLQNRVLLNAFIEKVA